MLHTRFSYPCCGIVRYGVRRRHRFLHRRDRLARRSGRRLFVMRHRGCRHNRALPFEIWFAFRVCDGLQFLGYLSRRLSFRESLGARGYQSAVLRAIVQSSFFMNVMRESESIGLANRKPWILSAPIARTAVACIAVSMPSAITVAPMAWSMLIR